MNTTVRNLDRGIVVVYRIALVGFGALDGFVPWRGELLGRKWPLLLAGNMLGWRVIGLAMFKANIAKDHLVNLAAYKNGVVFENLGWISGSNARAAHPG